MSILIFVAHFIMVGWELITTPRTRVVSKLWFCFLGALMILLGIAFYALIAGLALKICIEAFQSSLISGFIVIIVLGMLIISI